MNQSQCYNGTHSNRHAGTMKSKWKEAVFTTETLVTDSELKKDLIPTEKKVGNATPRIWTMKMYGPNEDDHSCTDMEMLPDMYSS